MRIYGGLKPADWQRWGRFTTFKANAPELLEKSLRADQIIYCSPLVDPYQPAEAEEGLMDGMENGYFPHREIHGRSWCDIVSDREDAEFFSMHC